MSVTLSKDQKSEIIASLQRYASAELECDLGEIQANQFLDYILKEIAPFAYNQGIDDAKTFFTAKLDDLTGSCFDEGLTYWRTPAPGVRQVRRKP